MQLKGIDVAKWNGNINWVQAKLEGVQFAILKVINKSRQVEDAFEKNYKDAHALNIPLGVYNYSYADTVGKATLDAQKVVSILAGRKITCRVWLDVEDVCMTKLGSNIVNIVNTYKKIIESAGYEFGIYTGLSFYNSYFKPYSNYISCPFWIARYPSKYDMWFDANPNDKYKPSILHPLWGWQYTSKGKMLGISGDIDFDIMYANVSLVTSKPLNPYKEPTTTLYKGKLLMSKNDVMWLQYELNEMGYGLVIDGKFGKNTDAALRDAQKRLKLVVDGKCGSKTITALKLV